jgi:glucokinase
VILGIDIGGTDVKFGIVDDNYKIVKSSSISTVKDKGDIYFINTIAEEAKRLYKEIPFDKIGVGSPGQIDTKRGICIRTGNLPYCNTPTKDILEKELNVPATIANDATCAVCGELFAGKGRLYKNFIMITLGTGVGGGIVIDGKPYFGKTDCAGEFGHASINYNGIECRCGQKGCYEQYASVSALIRMVKEKAQKYPDSILAQMCKDSVNGKTAFDAKIAGCSVASELIEEYAYYVALGIKNLSNIFNPDAIVISGGITNQGDNLINPIKEKINLSTTELFISDLRNNAGILGAVAIVKENILNI